MTDNTRHRDIPQDIENPKVSVIVPAYNAEACIGKCLDSIFNQTFNNFEVIVVNDGSTDHTREICGQYASRHSNMIVISQRNGGLSCARNAGINICKGEYIAFIDSDDYVEKEWLESYITAFSEYSTCDMVIQGLIINYQNHEEKVFLPQRYYEREHIIDAYYILKSRSIDGFMHNKIYKRKIIKEHHLKFEYELKEDLLFNYKYLSYISALVIIQNCNYHYVQHNSGSLIHKRYPADYMRALIISIRDAGLLLANKYKNLDFRDFVIADYILAYSVILFSMYQKANGIDGTASRLKYIKEYQQIRKENTNIKIRTNSKAKHLFASLMMMPPAFVDFVMIITKNILNKISSHSS